MRKECDNCGYKTKVKPYEHGVGRQTVYHFCDVCAKTFLSSATAYPNQCPDVRLHKSVGYIANMILDEIRKLQFSQVMGTPGSPKHKEP